MDALRNISERVHQAAQELLALKKERAQLLNEIEWLRRENVAQQSVQKENLKYKREQERLRAKLEKLNKKLEKVIREASEPLIQGGATS